MKLRHGQRRPRLGAHSRSISEVPGSLGQRYHSDWGRDTALRQSTDARHP
jgi:hypothetical protein